MIKNSTSADFMEFLALFLFASKNSLNSSKSLSNIFSKLINPKNFYCIFFYINKFTFSNKFIYCLLQLIII